MKTYEKIRKLREMSELTQENMAEKLNLSVAGYAKIENGKTHLTLKRLEQFAEIFDIDILELIQNESSIFYQLNDKSSNNQQGQNFYFSKTYENQSIIEENITLKAQIIHKDELITQLKEQIENLKEINNLLKKNHE